MGVSEDLHTDRLCPIVIHEVLGTLEIIFLSAPEIMGEQVNGNVFIFFFVVGPVREQATAVFICAHIHVLHGTDGSRFAVFIFFFMIYMRILIQRAGGINIFLHHEVALSF